MPNPTDHHVPPIPCPNCGRILDGAMALQGPDAPTPGDLTVCLHCGAMLRFGSELALLHRVSDREFYALPVDARMALVRARALVDKVRT